MEVAALVPVRHHSSRVPGKNHRSLDGRPLFQHIVLELLKCPEVVQVAIDTDSPDIKEQCHLLFPSVRVIDRPKHLLGGGVPMTKILQYDAGLVDSEWYLQTHATSPLLRSGTISAGLRALEAAGPDSFDSLMSVTRLQTRLYDSAYRPVNHNPEELLRTQDLPPLFEENSGMYVFHRDQIRKGQRFGERPMFFEIDPIEATDIDTETDFVLADTLHRLQREGVI